MSKITFIPEHVIISDEISRDGFRAVILRRMPDRPGQVFRFYEVEGGLNRHPELKDAWRTGAEITGDVYVKNDEIFIALFEIRPLKSAQSKRLQADYLEFWVRHDEVDELAE